VVPSESLTDFSLDFEKSQNWSLGKRGMHLPFCHGYATVDTLQTKLFWRVSMFAT